MEAPVGMKAYEMQEDEPSTQEYRALKYSILKFVIAASKGKRERLQLTEDGRQNLKTGTELEAMNL